MTGTQKKQDLASAIGWVPPAGWPAISREKCRDVLTAPGARFEMEAVEIGGITLRTWKNAPANLREVAMLGQTHGSREFVIYEEERVTYDAWFRAVAKLAQEFQARGISKGDRVALAMRNLPEWPVVFFAAVTIGAICVPLNAWWTGDELAYGLANSGTKLLVCDEDRWDRIAPHQAQCPDLKTIFVTRARPAIWTFERRS